MNNIEKIVLVAVILILVVGGGFIVFVQDSKRETIKDEPSTAHDMKNMNSSPEEDISMYSVDFTNDNVVKIDIDNSEYKISNIKIKQDTTVVWTNQDTVEHTIMTGRMNDTQSHSISKSGNDLMSPVLGRGESYSYIFNKAGNYTYHCSKHPSDTGNVTVIAE